MLIIMVMESAYVGWKRHVVSTGEINAYQILDKKPEGKRQLLRPRHGKDNIKMN
jgi:hypothetical protein